MHELQPLIEPSLVALKSRLEERLRLSRGPTLLERLDFITRLARWEGGKDCTQSCLSGVCTPECHILVHGICALTY